MGNESAFRPRPARIARISDGARRAVWAGARRDARATSAASRRRSCARPTTRGGDDAVRGRRLRRHGGAVRRWRTLARGGARAPPIAEHAVRGYKGHPRAPTAPSWYEGDPRRLVVGRRPAGVDTAQLGDAARRRVKAFYAPRRHGVRSAAVASAEAFMAIASDLKGDTTWRACRRSSTRWRPTFANVLAALEAFFAPSPRRPPPSSGCGARPTLNCRRARRAQAQRGGRPHDRLEPADPARAPTLTGWDERWRLRSAATRGTPSPLRAGARGRVQPACEPRPSPLISPTGSGDLAALDQVAAAPTMPTRRARRRR